MATSRKSVCYVDNGPDSMAYCQTAWRVIEARGLRPVTYANARLGIRDSNLDKELRDDFYSAEIAAVRLNGDPSKLEDHWVIPEFRFLETDHGQRRREKFLVYAGKPIPEALCQKLHLPAYIGVAVDKEAFAEMFDRDLIRINS